MAVTFNGVAMHLTSLCGQGATMIQPSWAGNVFTFNTETVATTVTGDADEPVTGHVRACAVSPCCVSLVYLTACFTACRLHHGQWTSRQWGGNTHHRIRITVHLLLYFLSQRGRLLCQCCP